MNDITQWVPVEGYQHKSINPKRIVILEVEGTGERRDEVSRCLRATMSNGTKVTLFTGDQEKCEAAYRNFTNHFGGMWNLFEQPPSTRPKK